MALVKLNNRGVRSATTFGSISGLGEMRFIKKLTASGDEDLSFVDGTDDVVLDDTYKEYIFTFNNIHPENDNKGFTFQTSTDGGSSYGVTVTTTVFLAYHKEDASQAALAYDATDLAQSTDFQSIMNLGNDNDQCGSGTLHLFSPSNTTFVKHFIARTNSYEDNDRSFDINCAGYFNTTSAIDAIQFKFVSGDIDAGDICLYGIN